MTWKRTNPMDEKMKFVSYAEEGKLPMVELCDYFGISRKTGYKWLNRYRAEGIDGLKERSRARKSQLGQTPERLRLAIIRLKKRYPSWGPKKLRAKLMLDDAQTQWPSASTIGELLKREGMVGRRRRRRRVVQPYMEPFKVCAEANSVWSADFKGQFFLKDQSICYPMTVTDNYSRMLLACDGYTSPSHDNVKKTFEDLFFRYGLPEAIRTDNGTPFASTSFGGLSRLSVWWIKLGIIPERIDVGHPEQNGRHERMHRTLKAETVEPPASDLKAQQARFSEFIRIYNTERPHEGIANDYPSHLFSSSSRCYTGEVPTIEYGGEHLVRKVRHCGEIKWKGKLVYVAKILNTESVELRYFSDWQVAVYFSYYRLGILDERVMKIVQ